MLVLKNKSEKISNYFYFQKCMLNDFILMILMLIIGVTFCIFEILRQYLPIQEIDEYGDKQKILSIFSIIGVRYLFY